ncbi:MAG: hypothetical protein QM778_23605 [Myxococcales bacterium]
MGQQLRVSGTPLVWSGLGDQEPNALETLRALTVGAPFGYVGAITEARATLTGTSGPDYTGQSNKAAQEYAYRMARQALELDLSNEGHDALMALLASAHGRAEVCVRSDPDATTLNLAVLDLEPDALGSAESPRYELFAGERDSACATTGKLLGRPCEPVVSLPSSYDEAARALRFQVFSGDLPERLYLTERGRDQGAPNARSVVGAVSTRPLDPSSEPRCATLALEADAHENAARVYGDEVAASIPRQPRAPTGELEFALNAEDPVPLLWGRRLTLKDPSGASTVFDLAQPFDAQRLAFEAQVSAACVAESIHGRGPDGNLCDTRGLQRLSELKCLLGQLEGAPGSPVAGYGVATQDDEQAFSLALWKHQLRLTLVAELGRVFDAFACQETSETASDDEPALESALWTLAQSQTADLQASFLDLWYQQADRIAARWETESRAADRVEGAVRALRDSKLAAARLLLAVPVGLYSRTDGDPDALDDAFGRFPVVTKPALLAEDALAESRLREAGLHPLLPDLSLEDGSFSSEKFVEVAYGDVLASRLRQRLVAVNPVDYQDLPATPGGFLSALGLTRRQLGDAAVRMVQLSEARANTLRPVPSSNPLQVLDAEAAYPAPLAAHLYALTEGRAPLAEDAWPSAFASRGVFHALGALEQAMARRIARSQGWSAVERGQREQIRAQVAAMALGSRVSLAFEADAGEPVVPTLELRLSDASEDPLKTVELWWTDAGALCATTGKLAGHDCNEADFRFSSAQSLAHPAGTDADGSVHVRLVGFAWPTAAGWDSALTPERKHGRVYVTRKVHGSRTLLGSASLQNHASPEQYVQPDLETLGSYLTDMLAYREPGEGCRSCRPSSVCEETACVVGLCMRTPLTGTPCAEEGQCVAGACDKPGCGDGARSNGDDGVPYEACDDGNLDDHDGCSSSCFIETRELEPTIPEGWPAGPAPAAGVDGLGRALVVYTADALAGETQAVRGASFDAFGNQLGPEFDIKTGIPRGYQARPTVAGLSQGGFVVAFASDTPQGQSGIVFSLVNGDGFSSGITLADGNGKAQVEPRVVELADGFAIAWVEVAADAADARIRLRKFGADGLPEGASISVASSAAGVSQREPTLASSLGQILVAWSESDTMSSTARGVLARRFTASMNPVDYETLKLASGLHAEPTATVQPNGDYAVAWTAKDVDPLGNVQMRPVRRFGSSPVGALQPLLTTAEAESMPVLAMSGAGYVLAYQAGSAPSRSALASSGPDSDALDLARTELSLSDARDTSLVGSSQGTWLVWSRRVNKRRALHALLLPP